MFNSHTNRRPKTGLTFKDTFLQVWPGAKCKKVAYSRSMTAYTVTLEDGTLVATAGNVASAWERACAQSDYFLAKKGLSAPAPAVAKQSNPVRHADAAGLSLAF